jgi:hypothetical protein
MDYNENFNCIARQMVSKFFQFTAESLVKIHLRILDENNKWIYCVERNS